MAPYIVLFFSLWVGAALELFYREKYSIFVLSIVTVVFLGLRFETGYDWPDYKNLFELTPSITTATMKEIFEISASELKEPLFVFFVSLLKEFGSEFQILVVICAVIQVCVFSGFLVFLKERPATVFAFSISWLIFTLYMSTLRQGLAVSFFLMFMVYMEVGNKKTAVFMLITSALFQYSAIAYLAVYIASKYVRYNKALIGLFVVLVFASLAGVDFSVGFLEVVSKGGIEMVNTKITYYLNEASIRANLVEKIYTFLFSIGMFWVLYFVRPSELDTTLIKRMYGMSLIFCVVGIFFYDFPLLRNRVQYLVLPFCYFFVVRYLARVRLNQRVFLFGVFFIINLLYFYLFIDKPSSVPFVPYQNYLVHVVTGEVGTGFDRYNALP